MSPTTSDTSHEPIRGRMLLVPIFTAAAILVSTRLLVVLLATIEVLLGVVVVSFVVVILVEVVILRSLRLSLFIFVASNLFVFSILRIAVDAALLAFVVEAGQLVEVRLLVQYELLARLLVFTSVRVVADVLPELLWEEVRGLPLALLRVGEAKRLLLVLLAVGRLVLERIEFGRGALSA